MFCPNPTCDHRKRTNKPAEFMKGVAICSDCGSTLSETAPIFKSVRKPHNLNSWTCTQCGLVNRGELPLCSCGYNIKRLHIDQKADKVAWPNSTSASPITEKHKLLIGYLTLLSGLFFTIILDVLYIIKSLDLAKRFGDSKWQPNYSSEIKIVVWNLTPYLIMGIDLLWQQIVIKKKRIKSIDMVSILIATTIGLYLFLDARLPNPDPFSGALSKVATPVFQLIIYGIARFCCGLKRNNESNKNAREGR